MSIRTLILAGALLLTPAIASSQSAATDSDELTLPGTAVHRVTTAGGRTYQLYVHLPASYATSDTTTYPVLYLTDAEIEVMAMYIGITNFLRITNRIDDVILVGVADGSVSVHGGLRRLDYTPTRRPADSTTSGGADAFLDVVRDLVIPLVTERYRTDRHDRGLWGYSFGGALAAHAMLDRPGMFQRYLLASPSLTWDDHVLVRRATAYADGHDSLHARAFTAYGADELPAGIDAWNTFNAALTASSLTGLSLTAALIPDADHTTAMPIVFMRGMLALYGRTNSAGRP